MLEFEISLSYKLWIYQVELIRFSHGPSITYFLLFNTNTNGKSKNTLSFKTENIQETS